MGLVCVSVMTDSESAELPPLTVIFLSSCSEPCLILRTMFVQHLLQLLSTDHYIAQNPNLVYCNYFWCLTVNIVKEIKKLVNELMDLISFKVRLEKITSD